MGKKCGSGPKDRKKKRNQVRKEGPPRVRDRRHIMALEIATRAQKALQRRDWKTAFARYEESNRILQELLENGENGIPHDPDRLKGGPDESRESFRAEYLHDLAYNYQSMAKCSFEGKFPDLIRPYTEKMLEYGLEYGQLCDSLESRTDLVSFYVLAVASLMEDDSISDPKLFVHYICSCLIHLEEACGKGLEKEQDDLELLQHMCDNLSICLEQYPETGDGAVDSIAEVIRSAEQARDFSGFFFLTSFLADLYDQMLKQSCFWKGSETTLEALFAKNTADVFDVLVGEEQYEPIQYSGEKLMKSWPSLKAQDSRACAANALEDYVTALTMLHEDEEAVKAAEAVLTCCMGDDGPVCPPLLWQSRVGRYVGLLVKTGQAAKAEEEVKRWMAARKATLRTGYTKEYEDIGITKEIYRSSIEEDTAIMFVQLALIAKHRDRPEEVSQCLRRAKDYLETHPKLKRERPDISRSIAEVQKALPADLADF